MPSDGNGKTILLVDDEQEVLCCLGDLLRRMQYRVLMRQDCTEALQLIRDGMLPDLVIADQLMPGLSGLEFIRILRQEQPSIPIILLTGGGSIDGFLIADMLGVFRYLQKPVDPWELKRTAADALAAGPGERMSGMQEPEAGAEGAGGNTGMFRLSFLQGTSEHGEPACERQERRSGLTERGNEMSSRKCWGEE